MRGGRRKKERRAPTSALDPAPPLQLSRAILARIWPLPRAAPFRARALPLFPRGFARPCAWCLLLCALHPSEPAVISALCRRRLPSPAPPCPLPSAPSQPCAPLPSSYGAIRTLRLLLTSSAAVPSDQTRPNRHRLVPQSWSRRPRHVPAAASPCLADRRSWLPPRCVVISWPTGRARI
ncbi:hypothetical protein PVAP13_4KG074933 [Panicum virgatum]|uniref:Uncharacterized protein n=1 Tax=Panicum virgatum TaxID=38727 RepID=A0A8T0TI44_PANVG|nr:hypothetical protein PVAP13_4KG074933 [Panicum virgatum]